MGHGTCGCNADLTGRIVNMYFLYVTVSSCHNMLISVLNSLHNLYLCIHWTIQTEMLPSSWHAVCLQLWTDPHFYKKSTEDIAVNFTATTLVMWHCVTEII